MTLTMVRGRIEVMSAIALHSTLNVYSGGFNADGQLGHLRRGPLCLKHTLPPKNICLIRSHPNIRLKQRSIAETLWSIVPTLLNYQS